MLIVINDCFPYDWYSLERLSIVKNVQGQTFIILLFTMMLSGGDYLCASADEKSQGSKRLSNVQGCTAQQCWVVFEPCPNRVCESRRIPPYPSLPVLLPVLTWQGGFSLEHHDLDDTTLWGCGKMISSTHERKHRPDSFIPLMVESTVFCVL